MILVAIGDGILQGVLDGTSWVDYLPSRFDVRNLGVDGTRAFDWANDSGGASGQLDSLAPDVPDIVVIMLGSTDASFMIDAGLYKIRLGEILDDQIYARWPDVNVWFAHSPEEFLKDSTQMSLMNEYRQAERELTSERSLLLPVFNSRGSALNVIDSNGTYWSQPANEVMGADASIILDNVFPVAAELPGGVLGQSEQDLISSLEDSEAGTGTIIRVYDPSGAFADLTGHAIDIGSMIDITNGELMSVQHAHIVLRIRTMEAAFGGALPEQILDQSGKPWRVQVTDVNGKQQWWAVEEAANDRSLGIGRYQLGRWVP